MFRLITARAFKIKEDLSQGSDGSAMLNNKSQADLSKDQQDVLNSMQTIAVTEHKRPSTRENNSKVFVSDMEIMDKITPSERRSGVWARYGKRYQAQGAPDLDLGEMEKLPASMNQVKPPPPRPKSPELSQWEQQKLIDDAKKEKMRKKMVPSFEETLKSHSIQEMRHPSAFPRLAISKSAANLRQSRAGFGQREHGSADTLLPLNEHLTHSFSAASLNPSQVSPSKLGHSDSAFSLTSNVLSPSSSAADLSFSSPSPAPQPSHSDSLASLIDGHASSSPAVRSRSVSMSSLGSGVASDISNAPLMPVRDDDENKARVITRVLGTIAHSSSVKGLPAPLQLYQLGLKAPPVKRAEVPVRASMAQPGQPTTIPANVAAEAAKAALIRTASQASIATFMASNATASTSRASTAGRRSSISASMTAASLQVGMPRASTPAQAQRNAHIVATQKAVADLAGGPMYGTGYASSLEKKLLAVFPPDVEAKRPAGVYVPIDMRLEDRAAAREKAAAEIKRQKKLNAAKSAEELKRLSEFGGADYDPLSKHKQEWLLVQARARDSLAAAMQRRAEVRSHVMSHPDLKAQAATILQERGVPAIPRAPHTEEQAIILAPQAPKQLSIWEETKFFTERALVEEEERAYEQRKRQFSADFDQCANLVADHLPPQSQTDSLFELVAFVRKLLDLGYPLDKFLFFECVQFLGRETYSLTGNMHMLRFVARAFNIQAEDIWTFFYQLGWTVTKAQESFLLKAPKIGSVDMSKSASFASLLSAV